MERQGRIAKAAGAMSAATLVSRVLGLVRDMTLASFFGAAGTSDTFFVAFRIPNLLRELFAEGSMSSAFVPVLTRVESGEGRAEATRLVRAALTLMLLLVGGVCALGMLLAPQIVAAIAPGFLADPPKLAATVLLTRIMFPFLLFVSLAALVMGALNTRRIFFVPALAPAVLNLVWIASVPLLAGRVSPPVAAVALGVAVGGFAQLAFQLPSFLRAGFSLAPSGAFGHPGLRRMGLLLVPATMGMAVAQVNIFVSNILASYLPQGSITQLYYAMRLVQFPVGIFGVAMGMAVLPALSEHAARGETDRLREDFSYALRLLFFITVPAMAGLIALRGPIVNLLFLRGRFDVAAADGTAAALLCYALGVWAMVGVRVVTATFYALQDTRTPVRVGVAAVAVNLGLSLALMKPLGHAGLALATACASMANFAVLFALLRRRVGRLETGRIARSLARTVAASAALGLAGWALLRGDLWTAGGHTALKSAVFAGAAAVAVGVYLGAARLLGSEELTAVLALVRRKTGKA
ncbi:MAG TPA: murein biosynthesis integral membrane protein MurJ [bacterium]